MVQWSQPGGVWERTSLVAWRRLRVAAVCAIVVAVSYPMATLALDCLDPQNFVNLSTEDLPELENDEVRLMRAWTVSGGVELRVSDYWGDGTTLRFVPVEAP